MSNPYRDESWLREQYCQNKLSTVKMAKLADTSTSVIQYWMNKHGIVSRSLSEARQEAKKRGDLARPLVETEVYHNEEWLREHYLNQQLTQEQMGELAGCSASNIHRWMKRYNIPTRPSWQTSAELRRNGAFASTYDEEWRCKAAKRTKQYWEKGVYDDPSIRARQSEASKAMWARGDYDHIFTEENRHNISEGVKAAWARGDFDDIREGISKAWERGAYANSKSKQRESLRQLGRAALIKNGRLAAREAGIGAVEWLTKFVQFVERLSK